MAPLQFYQRNRLGQLDCAILIQMSEDLDEFPMIVSGEVALGWARGMCEPIEDWEYVNPPCSLVWLFKTISQSVVLVSPSDGLKSADCILARATIKVISTHAPY